MSAKYKRIRPTDEALPAPLRWLTRAFSSITLSVCLLTLVAIYGMLGSVPVYFMAIGGLWLLTALLCFGGTALLLRSYARTSTAAAGTKLLLGGLLALLSIVIAALLGYFAVGLVDSNAYLHTHKATVIYRLPAFEMNEPEFFAWWPLRLILVLFVVNMVWATVRRIEFCFVNLGVLTVHTGIVVIALGSVLYSQLKLEGDMFILRSDLPGARPVSFFYDRNMPALFVSVDAAPALELPLPELPRYNDYAQGELNLTLHERPEFRERLGEGLRLSIPGFISYGQFERVWAQPDLPGDLTAQAVLTVAMGDAAGPENGPRFTLPAERPAERVIEEPRYAVEFLDDPAEARIDALLTDIDAPHVLLVDIPGSNFEQAFAIRSGQTIPLGLTGYTLTVEEVGPYNLPFVTEGYEDAQDTQATVSVVGRGKDFRRIVLHRYPERTQDFVEGQRQPPDPAIGLTYLDNTKPQIRLIHRTGDDQLQILLRLPGFKPALGALLDQKLPLPGNPAPWLHVVQFQAEAVPARKPTITPRNQRDPKLEGTYDHALVPVRIEYDLHDQNLQPTGETFERVVWLQQMPYLEHPGGDARPVTVDVPGYGRVELALGRQRFALPFAVAMTHFEMTPYAGSTIPRDFSSDLLIYPVDQRGEAAGTPSRHRTHLNNPVVYRAENAPPQVAKIKLSQAGWDPGDPSTTAQAKAERDAAGRFVNQQRFTILGVGNNVAIRMIAFGSILVALGVPWAFYVKPWLVRRRARRLARKLAEQPTAQIIRPKSSPPKPQPQPELVGAGDAQETRS